MHCPRCYFYTRSLGIDGIKSHAAPAIQRVYQLSAPR